MKKHHHPRCAYFDEPATLRDPKDCNCGAIPPLREDGPVTRAERAEERVAALELGLGIMEQEMAKVEKRCAELQAAIDKAHGLMSSSAYVGGPSERDAWSGAMEAMYPYVTQHIGVAE